MTQNANTFLQVRDLVVEYTSDGKVIHAVNGVNFDLERGKALALVGETGHYAHPAGPTGPCTQRPGGIAGPRPDEAERSRYAQGPRQRDFDDFPGPHDGPESDHAHRRPDCRGHSSA